MKELTIEIGLWAKPFAEQLKDYNIPKKQADIWEEISWFIIRQSAKKNITENQTQKLFKGLFEEIKLYLERLKGMQTQGGAIVNNN